TNVTFSRNVARTSGGGVRSLFGEARFANSIFWGNEAPEGRELSAERGRVAVAHSIVRGGLPNGIIDGGDNLAQDPEFINAVGADGVAGTRDDDVRLRSYSPAVDAGDNAALPPDSLDLNGDGDLREPLPVDIDGRVRVFDGG